MAWGSPQDYWWLRPTEPDNPLPAMQFGAQLRQQAIQNALKEKDLQLETQRNGIMLQEYFSKKELQNKLLAGNAKLAQRMSGISDMADPNVLKVLIQTLAEQPELGGTPQYEQFVKLHETAAGAKNKLAEMEAARLQRLEDKKTAPMLNLQEADRLDEEAAGLEATSPEKAAALRRNASLLRSTITAPTETIESYVDADGKQQFRITRGPASEKAPKDLSVPTTTTLSQIQQRELAGDKTAELGVQLLNTLTEADVGVRGNINQVLINEGIAQLIPGAKKGGVTEARTLLGQFNENAIKAIASDPRISDKDRKRYEQILPTLGAVESLSSAREKIKTFIGKFRDQARTDAAATKQPIPNWALSIQELREKIAKGELSEDDAVKIIVKYHAP